MEVIPYFPSLREMRAWMKARLAGASNEEAWRRITSDMRPRDLARTLVAGACGQPPLRLSVAIEGGSSTVKRGHPERWHISDHGRWRQMHLGAIDAAYGSTPFFPHLFPEIERIIGSVSSGLPFLTLTSRLNACIEDMLEIDMILPALADSDSSRPGFLLQIAEEKKQSGYDDFAFIDVIFRKGTESIFALLT